jgi:hypothetical protein
MTWHAFSQRMINIAKQHNSRAIVRLNPRIDALPLPIQRFDDPFLPFGKAVIDATRTDAVAYWLDLASYLTLGAAGARALERTIGYIGKQTPKIIHGPFVGAHYSTVVDAIAFDGDALTLALEVDLPFYLANSPFAAFVRQDALNVLPKEGGAYLHDESELAFYANNGTPQHFFITNDEVLYAGKVDNFEEHIQTALRAKQWTFDRIEK